MTNKIEYLIRGIKGEKDKIVWFLGEREGFVYVYELKESLPFKEVVNSLPEMYTRGREDEYSTKMQLILWIKKKYGAEPQEI
ncbi:MAG: hypothetical protein M0Z77_09505 [Thermoplasmatales archaeon]|jgi:hypothetical protein|nr:hypothetical protein [Thermoplasmatales archaeon]